jgi:hypothetical protein
MTGLRIECYLPAGTDSLSVVLSALSGRRVGMRGAHRVGWFAGCRRTPTGSYTDSANPPPAAYGSPRHGGVNRWISAKWPASTDALLLTR